MVSLISRRIFAERTEELEALLPDLVEFTLTPYLGSAEAAASLGRASSFRPDPVSPGSPLYYFFVAVTKISNWFSVGSFGRPLPWKTRSKVMPTEA